MVHLSLTISVVYFVVYGNALTVARAGLDGDERREMVMMLKHMLRRPLA